MIFGKVPDRSAGTIFFKLGFHPRAGSPYFGGKWRLPPTEVAPCKNPALKKSVSVLGFAVILIEPRNFCECKPDQSSAIIN